ncbi:murein L,D-transpeptidase family protein [Sinorhizobium sp. BG8]|uniref:L,D-transpeptidase family protein n=1 Tax=Sinorhizobium sp. BG8 TaxID=2613773 RepID=UPI00193D6205|nr:L,D-transpeptidase family protein [Sinorhizobium sp. BG8]
MRLKVLAAVSMMAVAAGGCTNDTLDTASVNLKSVSNKVEYPLSGQIVSKMASMNIDRAAPVMVRIFKEEGTLEVWKANRLDRFQMVKSYKICAWSGKLGPKQKEGDRQAPEGFYPLSKALMNPHSSYYLAINTGFPNNYDRANGFFGSNLMIHGACSSSGCYSMTDEQMIEIFAFARDAFKGGQQNIQLQIFPFRMTAENMARHRDNPNMEFWKMLKVGYDHFEVTKRPPEVNVCDKKYVFNQQATEGTFASGGKCPAMSTPASLQMALASHQKTYAMEYQKAMKKYEGTVWLEPSEAQRKAIVAEQRKGRELAYAPTGNSIDAGKLMTLREIEAEKKRAEEAAQRKIEMADRAQKAEEDRKAAELANLASDVAEGKAAAKATGGVPVPGENPTIAGVQAEPQQPEKKPFWKLWSKDTENNAVAAVGPAPVDAAASVEAEARSATAPHSLAAEEASAIAEKKPAEANPNPVAGAQQQQAASEGAAAAVVPGENANAYVAQAQPEQGEKKPFWKFWKK